MKKIIIACLLLCLTVIGYGQTPTVGDYRSIKSGNWSSASTWQVRDEAALGLGTWIAASSAPTSSNNVYIQGGDTVTVDIAGVCKDLQIRDSTGSLSIGANSVSVSGKLRAYIAVKVTTSSDDAFYTYSPIAQLTSNMISTTTGALRFVGASRSIIANASGDWGANGTGNLGLVEFSLDPGAVGVLADGIKTKRLRISSGTVSASSFISIGQSATSGITDSFVVKSGAKFITSVGTGNNAIGFNSTAQPCSTIVIEANATLEFTGVSPKLDTKLFVNNGTVIYSYTGNAVQNFVTARSGTVSGTDSLNKYVNLVLSGGGTSSSKTIFAGGTVTVSDTLRIEGLFSASASAISLGSVASKLTYGSNATLVFNSTTATWTLPATSIEWPATGGPKNIEIRKNKVQFAAATTGASRTITGSLILSGGAFNISQSDSLYMSNNSSLIKKSSLTTSTVDWSSTNVGYLVIGSIATDVVNIIIDANASVTEGKELKTTVAGYLYYGRLNLTIVNNSNYLLTGGRTIYNFSNSGILTLNSINTFKIQGNITGNGTITGQDSANITIDSVHTGSSQTLRFTPGNNRINNLVFNRVGGTLTSNAPFIVNRSLTLTNGTFNDGGFVDTVKGSIVKTISTISSGHVSGIGGKIVASASSIDLSQRSIDSLSFGNLEIGGNYTCGGFTVTGDLTLASGIADCNSNTILVNGNIFGRGAQSGSGRVKMNGSGKTVSGATFSTLEIASSGTITSTDTTRINTGLIISSGNFNDGGNIITVSGNVSGPGVHVSTGSGKIKMIAGTKSISVSGIEFGNLDISLATASSVLSAKTPFTVNNNLTITNGILVDSGNVITVKGNLSGTSVSNSSHSGTGAIKLTGSSNTISNLKVDSLEIASGANITALTDFRINKDLLLNGTINDGGKVISIYGSIIGSGIHSGTGKISMFGSAKSIFGGTRINNIEIASGASISATPPAVGCSAFISGLLIMNGNNLGIDTGNTLTMKNGSSIFRTSGNLNLNGGTIAMGENATDTISVTINASLLSSNELPGSSVGKIDLTINDGFSYTLRSNNKTVRNLYLYSGQLISDPTDSVAYAITSTGTATLAGNYTLNAGLNIKGVLKFDDNVGGYTLDANGFLTFKSTSSTTGSLAPVLNGNNIIGDATVERYTQNKKAWRLLYMPTQHNTQNIHDAWQEGGANNDNPNPGYGIQITSNDANWQANGFDTLSRTPSVKYFEPSTSEWVGIPSTSSSFVEGQAYMAFIRGNRSVTNFSQASTSTTLRELGNLNISDVSWNNLGTGGNQYVAIGNPYPSAISLKNVDKTNLDNAFYVWDPVLTGTNGFGAYQTMSVVSGNVVVAPFLGGSYTTNTNIESGQGFFVHTTGGSGSITFHETDKVTGSNLVARVPVQMSSIRMNLFKNVNNEYALMDGILHLFDSSYSNDVNTSDALKLFNPSENIAIKLTDKSVSIEARSVLTDIDTLHYAISQMKLGSYKFEITPEYLNANNLSGYLVDNYLHLTTPVSLVNLTSVSFDINNDAGSYAPDRFFMVFKTFRTTPVKFIDVSAIEQENNVLVSWNVENEININRYVVERSTDGINFNEIGFKAASQVLSYSWVDDKPYQNINYYRIKSMGDAGEILYSKIVKVNIGKNGESDFTISPNPVTETREVNIDFVNIPAGNYQLGLYDFSGRKVFSKNVSLQLNGKRINIKLNKSIPSGSYNLILSNQNDLKVTKNLFVK